MAVACASGYGAAKLLFLTDVDGVKGADGAVIPRLTLAESRQLIVDGVATGGMQAKLNAAADARLGGGGEVVIAPGAATEVLARLLAGEAVGTRFVKE
jgi:acetylglutamate kinase